MSNCLHRTLRLALLAGLAGAGCERTTTPEPAQPATQSVQPVAAPRAGSQRLDASGSPVDFDHDGKPDAVMLVSARDLKPEAMEHDAFGYGESPPDPANRCIEVKLAASKPGSDRVLCGNSSVLVLTQGEEPVKPGRTIHKGSEDLPAHIAEAAAGDVFTLPTQATDLAIYWTATGFQWEELSGGE